jgi:hypothetical protein
MVGVGGSRAIGRWRVPFGGVGGAHVVAVGEVLPAAAAVLDPDQADGLEVAHGPVD